MNERSTGTVPDAELERRWRLARAMMERDRCDALVIQGSSNLSGIGGNFRWFTGISVPTSYPRTVIFPRDDLMTLVTHGPAGKDAHFPIGAAPSHGIKRHLTTPMFPSVGLTGTYDASVVIDVLKSAGFSRIGIAGISTTYWAFGEELRKAFGDSLYDAQDGIDSLRANKSDYEAECIRAAARMQDNILANLASHIQPGMRDSDVMAYAHYQGQLQGSETGYFIGSSGTAGKSPAGLALRPEQNRVIRNGDLIYVQAENTGPGGYFTHTGRFYSLGKPPQAFVDLYGEMQEAQSFTLSLLKPGASCRDVFATYNDYMTTRGLQPESRLHCHGQGYDVVERPMARWDDPALVEGRLNIGLHPVSLRDGVFAIACDNFIVEADGRIERLHQLPHRVFEV